MKVKKSTIVVLLITAWLIWHLPMGSMFETPYQSWEELQG